MSGGTGRTLDPDQRAAVEVDVNAVVAAGAGSGKTTVLAERYLRLVRLGRADVEGILTLTFTRKAAAEMHDRIYRRLLAEQDDPRVAENLPRFDRAQISTLDSFCGQIARADSARFGVPPDFTTDEEKVAALAEQTAMEFLLANRSHPVLIDLIDQNGFDGVYRGCLVPLGLDYFHISRETDFDGAARRQRELLLSQLGEVYRRVDGLRSVAADLDPTAGKSVTELAAWYERLSVWPDRAAAGELEAVAAEARGLAGIRLPGAASKPDLVTAKELLGELRIECEAAGEIAGSLMLAPDSAELFRLMAAFEQILRGRKREQALLSFADVMEMAVAILRENLELRLYYQRRFSHILIDEFQDNNALQRDLLYLLAERPERSEAGRVPDAEDLEPGKLFFVGDEKQSIYLFRGADVSVFKGLSDELSSTGGRDLSLRTNYRSHPSLIRFFNALFSGIMAPSGESFEAVFEPLSWRTGREEAVEPLIRFLYKPFVKQNDAEGRGREAGETPTGASEPLHRDDAEAFRLASLIEQWVRGEPPLLIQTEGDPRPAAFDDIAILLRSGSNQIRYERMLRAFDIPYTSQTIRSLFLEAPLNDLYSLLQLLIYPYDRAAYAALLRSPFVQLSDDGVARVLLSGEPPFAPCELTEPDLTRYRAGSQLYEEMSAAVDRVEPVELLRMLWYDYGYRYTLLRDPAYHTYLEYFDYFCALAGHSGAGSLAELLDVVRPHLGKYEKLPELSVLHEQVRGVQIMTIHKSKGLEFPVVILANSGNTGRSEGSGSSPYYVHPEYGLTFNLMPRDRDPGARRRVNYFYSLGKEERRAREQAELKRLLYVGMTRAQSHLVVSGVHHQRNRESDDALLNIFLRGLEAAGLDVAAHAAGETDGGTPAATDAGFALTVEEISDVAADALYRRRGHADRVELSAAVAAYREAETVERSFARSRTTVTELNRERLQAAVGGAKGESEGVELPGLASDRLIEERGLEGRFGTLCHAVLQRRIGGSISSQGQLDLRLLREAGLSALATELTADELATLTADAWTLSDRFFESPESALLDGAESVRTELPFALRREEEGEELIIHGQIDLLVRRREELVVIDFKTDRRVREGEYDLQLEIYRDAAPDLAGGDGTVPVRGILFYLRGGLAK